FAVRLVDEGSPHLVSRRVSVAERRPTAVLQGRRSRQTETGPFRQLVTDDLHPAGNRGQIAAELRKGAPNTVARHLHDPAGTLSVAKAECLVEIALGRKIIS